jgi:hypothetical protein
MIVHGLPMAASERFDWAKPGFIVHFSTIRDPVSQVKIGKLLAASLLNLPEHGKGAQAAMLVGWIKYRINSG